MTDAYIDPRTLRLKRRRLAHRGKGAGEIRYSVS
jgi:hypothetical protein